jgi:hypothetical protein
LAAEGKHHLTGARQPEALNLDQQTRVYDSPSASRAAELGAVVSLLTRADDSTLRKIRELLEDAIHE